MNKYHDQLDSLLKDTLSVSKSINLKIWLESGTLLGCIRDKDYIPWDEDIDFGSWSSSLNNEKYKKFKEKMIKKKYIITKIGNLITIRKPSFICYADINFFTKRDNMAVCRLFFPTTKIGRLFGRLVFLFTSKNIFKSLQFHESLIHKIVYIFIYYIFKFFIPFKSQKKILNYLKKLKKKNSLDHSMKVPIKLLDKTRNIKFRNFTVPVPYRSSNLLKFRYGSDWKVSKPNWSPYIDDKTFVFLKKKE